MHMMRMRRKIQQLERELTEVTEDAMRDHEKAQRCERIISDYPQVWSCGAAAAAAAGGGGFSSEGGGGLGKGLN